MTEAKKLKAYHHFLHAEMRKVAEHMGWSDRCVPQTPEIVAFYFDGPGRDSSIEKRADVVLKSVGAIK